MSHNALPYHFLLQYSDATKLARMTDSEKMELATTIIQSGQTENSWNALLELFSTWPDTNAKMQAFDMASGLMLNWKDEERQINSSWKRIINNNQLSSVALLARRISINRREDSGNQELSAIANSPNAVCLERIDIDRSNMYSEGIRALTHSVFLPRLSAISFNGVSFTDENFELFINPEGLESLRSLTLKKCGITGKRINLLVHSKLAPQLEILHLPQNTIGDEGAANIASSERLSSIKILDLSYNFITDVGATTLAASASLKSLQQLILRGNNIINTNKTD